VEVERVELPADAPKALNEYLHVTVTRFDGKWIAFNNHFFEKWPWFVYAPTARMVMLYDGDKEMNLITTSDQGRFESKRVSLPKEWVEELKKQRPAQVIQVQDIGPDGKIRMRPLRPGERLPPSPYKDGEVVPPPKK
jgi:hypothetical protein